MHARREILELHIHPVFRFNIFHLMNFVRVSAIHAILRRCTSFCFLEYIAEIFHFFKTAVSGNFLDLHLCGCQKQSGIMNPHFIHKCHRRCPEMLPKSSGKIADTGTIQLSQAVKIHRFRIMFLDILINFVQIRILIICLFSILHRHKQRLKHHR